MQQGPQVERKTATEQDVKRANRDFYDSAATCYEDLDGRRSPELEAWLRSNLADIRKRAPGGHLLDIGSGSGLVTRCAGKLFSHRVAIDLSPEILAASRRHFDGGVGGDVDHMPFATGSFDVVTCFAVLHHLYSYERFVAELTRILRPGGIFYSDHDMESAFFNRFSLPLRLYRALRAAQSKHRANHAVSAEIEDLSEWHKDGINAPALQALLAGAGFSVHTHYHWFGLNPLSDRLFGATPRKQGWAPIVSFMAERLT